MTVFPFYDCPSNLEVILGKVDKCDIKFESSCMVKNTISRINLWSVNETKMKTKDDTVLVLFLTGADVTETPTSCSKHRTGVTSLARQFGKSLEIFTF